MPFCPNCRDEFEDWVKICPDCNLALMSKLPPLPPKIKIPSDPIMYVATAPNDSIMYVATAPNEPIAYFWVGILEDNGIRCLVKRANLRAAMYSLIINHYCTIYVKKSAALRARRILKPLENSHRDYVRSKKILFPLSSRIFIFIMFLFFFFR